MANVKISALPAVTTVVPGSDVLPLVSGGITTKATPNAVVQAVLPAPGAIGGTTPAAITGTTITANTGFVGSLNGSVGASIPNTGAFTTLSASSTVSGTGFSNYLASPPAIGGTTAAAGTFTNLAYTGTLTGSTGVINIGSGQVYKDASGNVGIGTSSPTVQLDVQASDCQIKVASTGTGYATSVFRNSNNSLYVGVDNAAGSAYGVANAGIIYGSGAYPISFFTNASEKMRLTSAGYLGIGTSSPAFLLDVGGANGTNIAIRSTGTSDAVLRGYVNGSESATMRFVNGGGLYWEIAGTERMRLDASGNLGLGVTPSGWVAGFSAFQFGSGGVVWSNGYNAIIGSNHYYNGSNYIYKGSDYASRFQQLNGQFQFYTAPSGTAGNAISFTQAMTLDASGRLVIGGTSAASGYNLTLRGAGLYVNEDSADTHAISLRSYWAGVAPAVQVVTNDPLLFVINGSERARIDSSGNLLVGTTSTLGKLRVQSADNSYVALIEDTNASYTSECLTVRPSRNTTNGSFYAYSYYNNGAAAYKFYVIDSGAIYSTSTSITSISDVSHKENVRDLNTGLAEVLALQPRRFDWKSGKGTDRKNAAGFIAQEVEIVLPELIEEWKENRDSDESLKAIRMGDMIPTLVKAIQELHAEIAALKAQLH